MQKNNTNTKKDESAEETVIIKKDPNSSKLNIGTYVAGGLSIVCNILTFGMLSMNERCGFKIASCSSSKTPSTNPETKKNWKEATTEEIKNALKTLEDAKKAVTDHALKENDEESVKALQTLQNNGKEAETKLKAEISKLDQKLFDTTYTDIDWNSLRK